ncbi:hypothetical protein Fcan01_22353 [Folsomia candida]|uniref:Uncharacterized protein n=1 Tax=Folsomia candida TaxID=158441 RepID=A0A226DBK9_FOLCA|nr:hypothetical protein Fcan01_22353 [Folsomia candida]
MFISSPSFGNTHAMDYALFFKAAKFFCALERMSIEVDDVMQLAKKLRKSEALSPRLQSVYNAMTSARMQMTSLSNTVTRMINPCTKPTFFEAVMNAGILEGADGFSIGRNIRRGLDFHYQRRFPSISLVLKETPPRYRTSASWYRNYRDNDGLDLHWVQLDFFAATRKLPPHFCLFATWGSKAVIINDNSCMRVDPSLLIQVRNNDAIRIIVVLIRFREEFLHWHFVQEVDFVDSDHDEYALLILNRDNGMGTYHNPLDNNRTASLSFVRHIADAFSACLRQTFFIHPAGTLSGHLFPYFESGGNSGKALALWVSAIESCQRLGSDLETALGEFMKRKHVAGQLIFDIEENKYLFRDSTLEGVLDFVRSRTRVANNDNIVEIFRPRLASRPHPPLVALSPQSPPILPPPLPSPSSPPPTRPLSPQTPPLSPIPPALQPPPPSPSSPPPTRPVSPQSPPLSPILPILPPPPSSPPAPRSRKRKTSTPIRRSERAKQQKTCKCC